MTKETPKPETKLDFLHGRILKEVELLRNRYESFDGKLDKLLEKVGTGSKLTPVWALILLALTFWAGCQVGGL